MEREVCKNCGTTGQEVMASGFVGCADCYSLLVIKNAVGKLYENKTHRGNKKPQNRC